MIKDAYLNIKDKIDTNCPETTWCNIYLNGKITIEETPQVKEFHQWITNTVSDIGGSNMIIHSYGFFFSKKNNGIVQEYHIDYLPEVYPWSILLLKMQPDS